MGHIIVVLLVCLEFKFIIPKNSSKWNCGKRLPSQDFSASQGG